MPDKNYTGIAISGETVSIDIMLPEQDPDDIRKKIAEELKIETGDMFIPFRYTQEGNNGIDFGEHGRRWHIRVVIDMSQKDDFYNSLRIFCKGHKFSFNGIDPSALR